MYWKIASAFCLMLASVLLMLDRPGLPASPAMGWTVSEVRVVAVETVPAHDEQVRRPRFHPRTVHVPARRKVTLSIVGYQDPTAEARPSSTDLVWEVPVSDPRFQDISYGQQWVACRASAPVSHPFQQVSQLARTRQQLRPCE